MLDLYLFHFMVLLNPDSNCSKCLLSSLVDKVTTGTYNFVPLFQMLHLLEHLLLVLQNYY